MLGRTNTGGGSGAGLNLKVVGNPQPTNPKENTVWINTDTDISGYAFSATEPENPTEGFVWITTSTASTAAMNVDKKNTVMLYPASCKQCISGAYVTKEAKTYQSGEWIDWILYLYNKGDECISITGGWQARALKAKDNSSVTAAKPTLTKGANSITAIFPTGYKSGLVEILNDVDLRGRSALKANILNVVQPGGNVGLRLGIMARTANYWYSDGIAFFTLSSLSNGKGVAQIDLTNLGLSESGYNVFFAAATGDSGNITVKFDAVWAE